MKASVPILVRMPRQIGELSIPGISGALPALRRRPLAPRRDLSRLQGPAVAGGAFVPLLGDQLFGWFEFILFGGRVPY